MFTLALVTGATSGIGEALCNLLAEQKVPLLITGRNTERLHQIAERLGVHTTVKTLVADLSIIEQRRQLIEMIKAHSPDLVINNAGFGLYGEALARSTAEEMAILEVNGNAVLEITLEAARHLSNEHKKGTICNIASIAAFHPFPNSAVYAASKAFVLSVSQALDIEFESKGVRVLAACPGMVATRFSERASGKKSERNPRAMSAEFAAKEILWQIRSGKRCHLFDWRYRWANYFAYLFPTSWRSRVLRNIIAKRLPKS